MKIFRSPREFVREGPSVVSVGNFDGVHRGHADLLVSVVARARELGGRSVVLTFEPHTRALLEPQRPQPILSTFEEKAALLEALGVDCLVAVAFDEAFRRMGPADFVRQVLRGQLGAVAWVMGSGHTFGRDRVGNKNSLRDLVSENDISLVTVKLSADGEHVVSSTGLRGLIQRGELARAVEMLGHPYLIAARRVRGKGRGTTLGYPTLNFERPPVEKVLPPPGVYAAHLQRAAEKLPGALYFGTCPTFEAREAHFEFHLLAATGDEPATGETSQLWVHSFVRADRTFAGPQELTDQIARDVSHIQQFFAEEK